jgi:hypothetical protein
MQATQERKRKLIELYPTTEAMAEAMEALEKKNADTEREKEALEKKNADTERKKEALQKKNADTERENEALIGMLVARISDPTDIARAGSMVSFHELPAIDCKEVTEREMLSDLIQTKKITTSMWTQICSDINWTDVTAVAKRIHSYCEAAIQKEEERAKQENRNTNREKQIYPFIFAFLKLLTGNKVLYRRGPDGDTFKPDFLCQQTFPVRRNSEESTLLNVDDALETLRKLCPEEVDIASAARAEQILNSAMGLTDTHMSQGYEPNLPVTTVLEVKEDFGESVHGDRQFKGQSGHAMTQCAKRIFAVSVDQLDLPQFTFCADKKGDKISIVHV